MTQPARLTDRFGLDDEQAAGLRKVIADFAEETGQDYVSVFESIDAGDSLLTALGLSDGVVGLLYSQAHARFNAGDMARALILFQTLVLLAPDVRDHWMGLGIAMRALGSLDSARLAFEVADKLDPAGAVAAYHLAEALFQLGERNEARGVVARALATPDTSGKRIVMAELERLRLALSGTG